MDHRGLDAAYDALSEAVSADDSLETARATAAFKFHLDLHLDKEDSHLYRLVRERISLEDQVKAVGTMAGLSPQERFPELIAWIFPLLGQDDRENITRVWHMLMPAEVFAGVRPLIQEGGGRGLGRTDSGCPGTVCCHPRTRQYVEDGQASERGEGLEHAAHLVGG